MSRWRYLSDDGAEAARGLATDEALLLPYGRGGQPAAAATLRLYTYRAHAALVGRHQSVVDEVRLDYCARAGIGVSRRPTGGGAIIMGPEQLGVALATGVGDQSSPRALLERFAEGIITGLGELGLPSAFRSRNDVEVGGRKIAGLGLYRDPDGGLLFHASVLVDLDVPLMLQVLDIPPAKLADKGVPSVDERVTTVTRELGRRLLATEVREPFRRGFAHAFAARLEEDELDADESERRDQLERTRYAAEEWIFQRHAAVGSSGHSLVKTPAGLVRFHVVLQGTAVKSLHTTTDANEMPAGLLRLETALRWTTASHARFLEASRALGAGAQLGVSEPAVADALWQAVERALGDAHPQRAIGSCYARPPESPSAEAR